MAFKDFMSDLFVGSVGSEQFSCVADTDGISLVIDPSVLQKVKAGKSSQLLTHQYVHLKMLAEEGLAEPIANGFFIESPLAVQLDEDTRYLLGLPEVFLGSYQVRIDGLASQDSFHVMIIPTTPVGDAVPSFQVRGPLLCLGSEEEYLMSAAEFAAIESIAIHRNLGHADKNEVVNLRLIAQLQRCRTGGLNIDLAHFEDLHVQDIERVKVTAQEMADGSLLLLPDYGDASDFEAIKARLWQLKEGEVIGSLKVGNKRLVLDEASLQGTREIIDSQEIAPDQVEAFINNPSAFLNGALVDLDEGYSLRVQGATEFKPKFFGDTDETGISWFEQAAASVMPSNHLKNVIKNENDLDSFKELFEAAVRKGSAQVEFKEEIIEVSDHHLVDRILEEIEDLLTKPEDPKTDSGSPSVEEEKGSKQLVLDVFDNDVEVEFGDAGAVDSVLYQGEIDWSAYKLKPFSYQQTGIRWILGLAGHTYDLGVEDLSKYGALLADDMGLGKTFMSLVAIKEYLDQSSVHDDKDRPVLIVAPLSLLENWEDEVAKVFKDGHSPFTDIVKLQANAHLPKYRLGGTEIRQALDADLGNIRHSLKIGKSYLNERLDVPRRLVLTTYETLRDYQFSLCRVDWSIVVFDEAQYMKNPNTLAAIAARALKARFKLIATGTPVENSLRDFWSLMDTAVPAYLGPWQEFRETYIKPINDVQGEERGQVRMEQGKALRTRVGPLMLRRIKEGELEGLPQKCVFTGNRAAANNFVYLPALRCPMPSAQQEAYEMVIGLVQEGAAEGEAGAAVLSGLHQLRDVSLHPDLLNGGVLSIPSSKADAETILARSGKLKQTFDLLHQIRERKEKVIIFCINKRLQAFVSVACERIFGIPVSVINGDTKAVAKRKDVATRRSILRDFEAQDGFGVVVMSPIAAGTGLTVVGANNVIHLERHWNPAKEAQATDRVYRIGQKKEVNVYLPILTHPSEEVVSFDQNLDKLLQQKIALKDAVVTPEDVSPADMGEGVFKGAFAGRSEGTPMSDEDLDRLGWKKFEAFTAELIARTYFGEALLTADGPDHGADAVLRGKENILIQAKFTGTGRLDGASSVREVFSAKPIYENSLGIKFDRLIVATNAVKVDERARSAASASGVEILSRKELVKMMAGAKITTRDVSVRLARERLKV